MVNTVVKKVTVGVPIRGVTSGAFSISNLGGVSLTNVGTGDILVYDASVSGFVADSDTYIKTTDSAEIKSLFSAGGDLSYDSAAGQFSINVDSFASAISAVSFGDGTASAPSITNTSDTDTGLHFPSANTLAFTAGGTSQFTMANGVIAPVTDNDVDLGTSSLEFKDAYFDGTVHTDAINLDGTAITSTAAELNLLDGVSGLVQADFTKLAAVTSSATELNLLDGVSGLVQADFTKLAAVTSSADEINLLDGVSGLVQADFTKLAAVTSSATELNLLDGVSGLVQADFTKLAAVTASTAELNKLDGVNTTTTELNILDGDTSASSTTIADADRVIVNDGGTMKQVAVTDLAAYFDDEITAMPNLTSVGTLSTLTVDDVIINGATIGHTSDTDLITVASGVMTVAGEVDAVSLDISGNADIDGTLEADAISIDGTTITATAAELNALDGINSTVTELNIVDGDTSATSTTVADADRVVFNDGGTMKQVAVTDLAAYFDDEITAMPNLVTTAATTVGALDAGSITSNFGAIDIGSSNFTTTGIAAVGRLQADNIRIDGNAITSTAGTDLTITPVAGQQIVLDGTIVVDAGVVTGATSITSTAFVGGLTGNVTGNASGTALSVTQAAQSAITSLGTLTTLTVDDIIINGGTIGHTSDTDAITIASDGDVTFSQSVVVSGNLTITGTTTQVNTVTMNAQNAVVFEGATADAHETTLTIVDPTADRTINLPNVSGTVPVLAAASNTAITATPAEINILDDAVITTAELNILDGGTSATSTTVVSADRVILNDDGTMKQVAITDLQTFINAGSSNPNLTSVGALNAGSITTGFGSINVGSDSVSTTGLLTFGTLNDGTTSMTSTVAELNIMDGGTSATSTTIVDADRVIVNDNGTMKQVAVTDLSAYFDDEITAMGNLVETGALNAGSITSGFGTIDIGSSAFTTTGTGTVGTLVASSLFKMPDNTSTKFLVADGTSYQEVAMSGDATMANTGAVTIAADAVEGSMLNDNAISGQTELASGIADTDELLISDGGTLKRTDASVFKTYLAAASVDDATALAIALG